MITKGEFTVQQLTERTWEFTCSKLPDWRNVIEGTREEAMACLANLQDAFRGTWEEEAA